MSPIQPSFDAHIASIEKLHKELRQRVAAMAEPAVVAAQRLRRIQAAVARTRLKPRQRRNRPVTS
jgi:hypothetical protein